MDNLFFTVLLIIGIVILAIPKSVSKTVKKALPILLVFLAVSAIAFLIKGQGNSTIQIVASNDQNEKAEGNEIFLKEVIVNGESKKPGDIFSKGWIEKDGGLLWRNYDRIDGMTDSIQAEFQNGEDVVLVLKQNKWQGKARIISTQGDQGFDGYTDSESENWMNFEVKLNAGSTTFLTRKNLVPLAVIIWVFLVAISLICKRFFPEQKRENKDRLIGLDLLKIVSAFMIILIHSSANIYNNHAVGTSVWFSGVILNTIPRFAVPTFLMISGALLLKNNMKPRNALRKALYAGVALVVWSISYILAKKILWNEGNIIYDILSIPFKIGPSGHLWYGYLIVWIYIFLPVLKSLYDAMNEKLRLYFVLFGLFVPGVLDGVISCFSIDGVILERPTFIYIHLGYIAIIFLGRTIYENRNKIGVFTAILFSVVGFAITTIVSVEISKKNGTSVHTFFFETQISNVMYATGVMLLFSKIKLKNSNGLIRNGIIRLSKLSLGIYFSHSLLMWAIGESIDIGGIHLNIGNSIFECIAFVCITFIGTVIMIAPLANIPYLKKLVKIS